MFGAGISQRRGTTRGGNRTTSPNNSSDDELLDYVNTAFGLFGFAIIALEIIAIIVLAKCKRLSYQIKYLSVNYILANTIYHIADTGNFVGKRTQAYEKTVWSFNLEHLIMQFR